MPRHKKSPDDLLYLEIWDDVEKHDFQTAWNKINTNQNMREKTYAGIKLIHVFCNKPDIDAVKFFVENVHQTTEVTDSFGRTPLHVLCAGHNEHKPDPIPLMHYLIFEKKANIFALDNKNQRPDENIDQEKYPEFYKAYSNAYYYRQVVDKQLMTVAQATEICIALEKGPTAAMTTFTDAIRHNQIAIVSAMVHAGIDINLPDEFGYRALIVAISTLNVPIVKYLLSLPQLEVNFVQEENWEALGNMYKELGIKVETPAIKDRLSTPMMKFALLDSDRESFPQGVTDKVERKLQILELLSNRQDFDINFQAKGYYHPLILAQQIPGNLPIVKKLIEKGLNYTNCPIAFSTSEKADQAKVKDIYEYLYDLKNQNKPASNLGPQVYPLKVPQNNASQSTGFSFSKLMSKIGFKKADNQENQNNQVPSQQQPPASSSNWSHVSTPN